MGMVIWIVLMCLWLFFGGYYYWDAQHPHMIGGTIIPWLCVAILGWRVFRGDKPPAL